MTLGVIALALLLSAAASAGAPAITNTYTVGGSSVPGLSTGLVLAGGSVTVTATGAVCPYGNSYCPGPDGNSAWNTTTSVFGGFPAPGAPAWGLIARVGSGSWVHVGSGPTPVSGTGVLEFAVNDDLLVDNVGSFTVTVTSSRAGSTSCKPGWGYGDKNHEHCGPPGLVDRLSAQTASSSSGPGNGNGNAKGHAKR